MNEAYLVHPDGEETQFPDGSQWVYGASRGHIFTEVIGVVYDQSGYRDADKILTVNRDPRGAYKDNPQYRAGKIHARSRYEMTKKYHPRPPASWEPNVLYRLRKSDGATGLMTVAYMYADGSAVLVPLDSTGQPRIVPQDERSYWTEVYPDEERTDEE